MHRCDWQLLKAVMLLKSPVAIRAAVNAGANVRQMWKLGEDDDDLDIPPSTLIQLVQNHWAPDAGGTTKEQMVAALREVGCPERINVV